MVRARTRDALVERDRELARLTGRLVEARTGNGGLTIVDGPPGIGKTSLLDAARGRGADMGMRELYGRGAALERGFAYGVLRQAIAPALAALPPQERAAVTAGAAAHAAVLFAPEPRASSTEALLHGLYWLLSSLGERAPLILAVEDAHWADDASIDALSFLARRAAHLPLAIVVATRPPDPDGSAALATLVTDPTAERLTPTALGEPAIATLSGSDDRPFVRAAASATGGNPFLLEELLRELGSDRTAAAVAVAQPRELGRTVLARLGEGARALARALVILGDGATPAECAALAGVDGTGDAVEELLAAGLLVEDGALRFRHPLLETAVAAGFPAARREEWHARAAAILRERGAGAERLAAQLAVARPAGSEEVVDALLAAAEPALARGASAEARRLLERALAEPPDAARRPAILMRLGEALSHGSEDEAAEALAEAARESPDPGLRTRALEVRARLLWAAPPAGVDAELAGLDELLASLPPDAGDLRVRLGAARLVVAQRSRQRMPLAMAHAERSGLLEQASPDALAIAALWHMREGGAAGTCAAFALRATDAAAATGAYHAAPPGLWFPFTTIVLRAAERLGEAAASARTLQDATRANGSATWYRLTTQWHARLLADGGELRAAEEDARLALAAGEPTEPWMRAHPVRTLVAVLVERGQAGEAARVWSTVDGGGEIPDSRPMTELLLTRARLHEALGDTGAALADAGEAVRRLARAGTPSMQDQEARLLWAELLLASGDRAAAAEAVSVASTVAEAWGTAGARGAVLRLHGLVEQSPEHLRAAAELLGASPLRLEHARALADLGAALRRANHRGDAREPLRTAYELAAAGGADRLAAAAAEELTATGERVPVRAPTGADALTPAERRIARMASGGATNKEIAQALFVSVKTVEMHLGHGYRKLGVGSRRDLARVLAMPDG